MDIHDLLDRHLELFNDPDSERRRTGLYAVYAGDLVFIDPHARADGLGAFNNLVDALHAKFPGFVLQRIAPADAHHDIGRFSWALQRRKGEPVHGTDFIKVEGERIKEIVVFFDQPSQ